MIIYEGVKKDFVQDIEAGSLIRKLKTGFINNHLGTSESEIKSWQSSLQYMYMILNDAEIPASAGVAIEYRLPTSSKRIDFLITGKNTKNSASAVIVELKQWTSAEKVIHKDGIVRTVTGGGMREVLHPSYQAWSYAGIIQDYNETVRRQQVGLYPCAYLHNYLMADEDPLLDKHYENYLKQAPIFALEDVKKLRDFIKRYITVGDNREVLYQIEYGVIKPSKSLQDSLSSMLKGNSEFTMIDEQKLVYEKAYQMAMSSKVDGKKRVLIVSGGPGTGKSVLAINLLAALTGKELVCQYVTKNSAPRNVYKSKLKGAMLSSSVDHLFKGSGVFTEAKRDEIDAILVDEAHRLNEKSGMFMNLGENQMKEIIYAGKCSVFFIDESQRVHIKDAGRAQTIRDYAMVYHAEIEEMTLSSQFRCNGSDGYLAWLDDVLEIHQTANADGFDVNYDIQIFDSPHKLREMIYQKNMIDNKARIVAGYCWEWDKNGRSNPDYHDIQIPEHAFKMSWNMDNSNTWAIDVNSVAEAGCIHTAQGLEFDWVGVIVGEDLRYESDRIVTDHTKRAKTDQSLKGIKNLLREKPQKALQVADEIIKNTYRTLMTRGQKGCYLYCVDAGMREYLRKRLYEVRPFGVGYHNNDMIERGNAAEKIE